MTPSNLISVFTFTVVAQIAHVAATYAISYTAATFHGWRGWRNAAIAVLAYAIPKEFIFDRLYENAATRGSDLEDFLFLMTGLVIAFLTWGYHEYTVDKRLFASVAKTR